MAVTKEDDSDAAWSFATGMTVFAVIMSLIVLGLILYIRNLKKQRRNANNVKRHEKASVEHSDTESPSKQKKVKSTVVGVHMKNANSSSTVGLREFHDPYNVPESSQSAIVQQPEPYQAQQNEFGETSNTQMLGTQSIIGTFATHDKLRDADHVEEVNPQNVQLDFDGAVQSTGNDGPQSNRGKTPGGNNPFATESSADLGLSDRSEAGPTG